MEFPQPALTTILPDRPTDPHRSRLGSKPVVLSRRGASALDRVVLQVGAGTSRCNTAPANSANGHQQPRPFLIRPLLGAPTGASLGGVDGNFHSVLLGLG